VSSLVFAFIFIVIAHEPPEASVHLMHVARNVMLFNHGTTIEAELVILASILLGILLILDKIPSVDEVVQQVGDNRPNHGDSDIRPAHPTVLGAVQLILMVPVVDTLKIEGTSIVEILSRENDVLKVARMCVRDWMTHRVPSPEAHIETAHEADSTVHDTQLLMMGPVEDAIAELSIDRRQSAGGGFRKVARPVALQG